MYCRSPRSNAMSPNWWAASAGDWMMSTLCRLISVIICQMHLIFRARLAPFIYRMFFAARNYRPKRKLHLNWRSKETYQLFLIVSTKMARARQERKNLKRTKWWWRSPAFSRSGTLMFKVRYLWKNRAILNGTMTTDKIIKMCLNILSNSRPNYWAPPRDLKSGKMLCHWHRRNSKRQLAKHPLTCLRYWPKLRSQSPQIWNFN